MVLRLHQHSIGYTGDDYSEKMQSTSVQKIKERRPRTNEILI